MDGANVTVVYAADDRIHLLSLRASGDTTIGDVIRQSGLLQRCPEIDLDRCKVGIFNRVRSLSDRISDGDRIEVYRPLHADPKQARRLRAARQQRRKDT